MKKARLYLICYIATAFISMSFSTCCADALSALSELGKGQEGAAKILNEETSAFDKIKMAMEEGVIRKGESQDVIIKRYGEPVVILGDKGYAEKWIYKPGNASWFEGVKIYLFFDENKKLQGIKMLGK